MSNTNEIVKDKLKLVELFAGTGAFSLAFEKTKRFKTIYANDFDINSKKIYDMNFDIKLFLGDLNTINIKEIPKMDILTGGFPCQPFSIAGKQKGFKDNRSNVFWKIIEIIKEHKPRFVVLENVKNLKSHDYGKTFKTIEKGITDLKYYISHQILNTYKITNIPQNRERIYIICFREKDDYKKFRFPIKTDRHIEIKDFIEDNIDDKYYYTDKLKIWEKINQGVSKHIDTNTIYQYRRYYIRENKKNICPTLTANMGTGGHNVPLLKDNKGIRKLTPKECFKLQGFPQTFNLPIISDNKLYKLAGNAVTVSVVEKIAEEIVKLL